MSNINQILSEYVQISKDLYSGLKSYFEKISDIMIKFDKNSYQNVYDSLQSLISNVLGIEKLISCADTDLIQYINIYEYIKQILANIDIINNIVMGDPDNKYIHYLIHNMSQTFSSGVYQEKARLLELVNKIKKTDHKHIFSLINSKFDFKKNADNVHKIIIDSEQNNIFITYIISSIIDFLPKKNQIELLVRVEKLKSDILLEPIIKYSANDILKYSPTQIMLLRRGLAPSTISINLESLFDFISQQINKKIKWDKNKSSSDNFEEVSKKYDIGLIIIYHRAKMPVEFNILPLIDTDFINENNLITSTISGISKKIIRRYDTIRQLDNPPGDYYNAMIGIKSFIGRGYESVFIVETYNDTEFRLLETSLFGLSNEEIITNITHPPPIRNGAYNKIMSDVITCNSKIANHEDLMKEYESEKKAVPSTQKLKDALRTEFIKTFENSISEISSREIFIFKATSKQMISGIINSIMVQEVFEESNSSIEYFITFLHKLDDIIAKFGKELMKAVSSIRFPPLLFKEKAGKDLYTYLLGAFGDAVKTVIEELDNEPSTWKNIEFSLKEFMFEKKYLM